MHVRETTIFDKNELYTTITSNDFYYFDAFITLLQDNGNYIDSLKTIGEDYIAENKNFYIHFSRGIWQATLELPNKRYCLVHDFMVSFMTWINEETQDAIRDLIKIMFYHVCEKYNVIEPSFYVRATEYDSYSDTLHGGLFISLGETWKDSLKVLDFRKFEIEIVLEIRKIMLIFGGKAVDVYVNSGTAKKDLGIYVEF